LKEKSLPLMLIMDILALLDFYKKGHALPHLCVYFYKLRNRFGFRDQLLGIDYQLTGSLLINWSLRTG
jgi:hypothetical protein